MLKNTNKKVFIITAVILLFIFSYYKQNYDQEQLLNSENEMNILATNTKKKTNRKEIVVHLSGAVNKPGVYRLNSEKRLVDLITAAGGLEKNADLNKINLAEKIFDGQKIVIPKINQTKDLILKNSLDQKSRFNNLTNYSSQGSSDLIDINQADQSDLEKLSGIGPAKAAAIIKHREENGNYKQKKDLLDVSGIGKKTLANIEDEIRLR